MNTQSCLIQKGDTQQHLIVFYGGRNDGIFSQTKNVALNDICMFNVNKKEWISLAIYGSGIQPCSRWSHIMLPNTQYGPDGFAVLGGVNLNNYCKSYLYQFQIMNYGSDSQEKEAKDDAKMVEKLEKLMRHNDSIS